MNIKNVHLFCDIFIILPKKFAFNTQKLGFYNSRSNIKKPYYYTNSKIDKGYLKIFIQSK